MPSVSIAPPTKAQTTTAITLKANCSVIFNPFFIKFTLLTPLGYNQITKRNPKGAKTMNEYEITLELLKLAAQEGAFKSSNKDELIQDIVKAFNDVKAEILKKTKSEPKANTQEDDYYE